MLLKRPVDFPVELVAVTNAAGQTEAAIMVNGIAVGRIVINADNKAEIVKTGFPLDETLDAAGIATTNPGGGLIMKGLAN